MLYAKYFNLKKGLKMKRVTIFAMSLLFLSTGKISFAAEEVTPEATLTRKPSYDALLKGWNSNSVQWGLEHDGESYSHYGTECEVRPGSDDKVVERWTHFGKSITNLDTATKFIAVAQKRNLALPQEALTPSQNLIKKDNEEKTAVEIAYNLASFIDLNSQIKAVVLTFGAEALAVQQAKESLDLGLKNKQESMQKYLSATQKSALNLKTKHNRTHPTNRITEALNISTSQTYAEPSVFIELAAKLNENDTEK